jgi:hypothetical protein
MRQSSQLILVCDVPFAHAFPPSVALCTRRDADTSSYFAPLPIVLCLTNIWLLPDHEFQRSFPGVSRHIYRQILRIFAHIYHAHFHQILHLRAEPHFNSLFAHFLAFGKEFDLLEIKEIVGDPSAGAQGVMPGIGLLWEKWTEMGTLAK